jgi:glycosyltransferase involved in cell wall biosynthesis
MAIHAVPPPEIPQVALGVRRPFWSVMFPVRNRTDFIGEAVASVLAQDPGPREMELWLVDNSTNPIDFLSHLPEGAHKRVRIFRQPTPLDIATNWNSCVRLACGQYVHVLHDDDYVLPGFYAKFRMRATARPDVGLLACCAHVIRADGTEKYLSDFWSRWETPSHDDESMFLTGINPLRTPGVVVRRETYEAAGGFRPELTFYVDWDMWLRAARTSGAWMMDEALVCYREHTNNITANLNNTCEPLEDLLRLCELMKLEKPGLDLRPVLTFISRNARISSDLRASEDEMEVARRFDDVWRETATPREKVAHFWRVRIWQIARGVLRRLGRRVA